MARAQPGGRVAGDVIPRTAPSPSPAAAPTASGDCSRWSPVPAPPRPALASDCRCCLRVWAKSPRETAASRSAGHSDGEWSTDATWPLFPRISSAHPLPAASFGQTFRRRTASTTHAGKPQSPSSRARGSAAPHHPSIPASLSAITCQSPSAEPVRPSRRASPAAWRTVSMRPHTSLAADRHSLNSEAADATLARRRHLGRARLGRAQSASATPSARDVGPTSASRAVSLSAPPCASCSRRLTSDSDHSWCGVDAAVSQTPRSESTGAGTRGCSGANSDPGIGHSVSPMTASSSPGATPESLSNEPLSLDVPEGTVARGPNSNALAGSFRSEGTHGIASQSPRTTRADGATPQAAEACGVGGAPVRDSLSARDSTACRASDPR